MKDLNDMTLFRHPAAPEVQGLPTPRPSSDVRSAPAAAQKNEASARTRAYTSV